MKLLYRILTYFHGFIGFGGMAGGLAAITNPESPMGITTEALKNGPFNDFLIPGLFLFIVIGLGNLVGAFLSYKKIHFQAYFTGGLGIIMMMWIVIQCLILEDIVFLHILFFSFGFIQCLLAFILALKKRLFPLNIIFKKYKG